MKPKSNPFLRNLLTAATLGLGSAAHAQSVIDWSATAGTTAWATGGNWVGGTAPTSDPTTHIARFNQATYTNQPNYGTTSIAGIIVGNGTTAVGNLTLSGTTLSIGASGIDIKAASGTVNLNNAVRLGASQTWANNSSSLFTVGATVTNVANLAPYILTIDGTGNTTMSAAITNGGAIGTTGLTKNGSGTLTLSSNSNTFTGGLILSAGTLRFSQVNALGGGNVTIGGSGNTVIDNTGGNQTVAGVTGWTLTGAGTITRANSGTSGTGGGIGWGTAKITGSSGGLIYTAGSAGSGIQVGAVTSDYTGGTTLTSGTIILNGTSNGDTSTAGSFGNGSVASNVVTFNGASLRGGSTAATRTIFNNISFAADTTLAATSGGIAGTLTWAGEVTLNGTGTARKLTQASATQDWVFSNTIKNGTVSGLNVDFTGARSVTLSGANTFNGTLLASGTGGGSLALGNVDAVKDATLDTGTSTTSRAVTFTVAGNNTYNIGALQGADNLDIQGNTISVGAKAADTSFTGVISNSTGTGNLIKTGGNRLTLSGANTYTGGTTVNGGILNITGSTASGSAVFVGGGSAVGTPKLTGSGTINGAVSVKAASGGAVGILNAGDATAVNKVGSLSMGSSLAFETGSIFEWDINANSIASGFDTVAVGGSLNGSTGGETSIFRVIFGATAKAGIEDGGNVFWNTASTSRVWSMTSLFGKDFTSGSFTSVQTYDATGAYDVSAKGSFTITGTSLTWTAVPEPTSALAGLLMGAGLLRRRRKRVV